MLDPTYGAIITGLVPAVAIGVFGFLAKGKSDPASGTLAMAQVVERLQVEGYRRYCQYVVTIM